MRKQLNVGDRVRVPQVGSNGAKGTIVEPTKYDGKAAFMVEFDENNLYTTIYLPDEIEPESIDV